MLSLADEQWGLVTTQQVEAMGVAWSTLARQVRNGILERVAHGVYRVRGTGGIEHLDLRAAWLQLHPAVAVWERGPNHGVVSHRSAAALYGIGHLPADVHEFTLPMRRQTRRVDVRLHLGTLATADWTTRSGLPVTRLHQIAADMLHSREEPEAVGQILADGLREAIETPRAVAEALKPFARRYGFPDDDGIGLLDWLLGLSDEPERDGWVGAARAVETGTSATTKGAP